MNRLRSALLVALAASVLVPVAAGASGSQRLRTVRVHATLVGHFNAASDGVTCPAEVGRLCGARYSGEGLVTGDLSGPVVFTGTEWVPVDGSPTYSDEVLRFTGTVRGCGSGSITYFAHPVDTGPVDPAAGGYRGEETWRMPAGSGSGGLKSIRGSGTSPWVLRPDATYGATVTAEYAGTVTCARPRRS
jgi:hypothetical protein